MPDRTVDWGGVARRYQEVAPGEWAQEVYTRGLWDSAVARGRAYIATSDRIETTLTNTHIVALIENPVDSGALVTVARVAANINPNVMVLGQVFLNPTGGLPTDERAPFNLKSLAGDVTPSSARFLINRATEGLSGGTLTDVNLTVFQGRNELDLGIPLAPGTSIGVSIPLGTIEAGDGTFAVYLAEEPI